MAGDDAGDMTVAPGPAGPGGLPRLPEWISQAPAAAPDAAAVVPPPPAYLPPRPPGYEAELSAVQESDGFVPLRVDPPPHLVATWWLRWMLLLTSLVCIAVVVMAEYATGPGGLAGQPIVIVPHVLVAVLMIAWSVLAMIDAGRLVPRTRYRRRSNGPLAALLWLFAFAAPVLVWAVIERAEERFDEPSDDLAAVAVSAAAVLIGLVVVWLPFRYLAGQAHRIGAPGRAMVLWYASSLLAGVGVLAMMLLGLEDLLSDGGTTASERAVRTAVVYGVPAFVFGLSMWRATSVFDEVIDLRWRRWRAEWELTLKAMAAEPPPGPEASPAIDRHAR